MTPPPHDSTRPGAMVVVPAPVDDGRHAPPPRPRAEILMEHRREALHALVDRVLDANPAMEAILSDWLGHAAEVFTPEQRTAILDVLIAGREVFNSWR